MIHGSIHLAWHFWWLGGGRRHEDIVGQVAETTGWPDQIVPEGAGREDEETALGLVRSGGAEQPIDLRVADPERPRLRLAGKVDRNRDTRRRQTGGIGNRA